MTEAAEAMTRFAVSFAVSYRDPFCRRLYSFLTHEPGEATSHAAWLAANGRRRVRIDVSITGEKS